MPRGPSVAALRRSGHEPLLHWFCLSYPLYRRLLYRQ